MKLKEKVRLKINEIFHMTTYLLIIVFSSVDVDTSFFVGRKFTFILNRSDM